MKIVLNDAKSIREIQKEFNDVFPCLKIEFFDMPYTRKSSMPKSKIYNVERKLGICRIKHNEGVWDLDAQKTVAEIEKELWEKYGLTAQIFRKLGNLWIETNLTDTWTLEKQNNEGHNLRFGNIDTPEKDDPNK